MLISKERKLIFIHVQKTGGASLGKMLKNYIPDITNVLRQHATVKEAKDLLGDEWNYYYKFAFVRNPWDRLVSWYSMMTQYGKKLSWYEKIISPFKKEQHNKVWQYVLSNSNSFEDFIYNCSDATNRAGWKPFLNNQLDYLVDESDQVSVDYIGRYENISHDIADLFCRINIDNTEIPHLNKSSRNDYRDYYSDDTREIVAKRFEKDIIHFNYRF